MPRSGVLDREGRPIRPLVWAHRRDADCAAALEHEHWQTGRTWCRNTATVRAISDKGDEVAICGFHAARFRRFGFVMLDEGGVVKSLLKPGGEE